MVLLDAVGGMTVRVVGFTADRELRAKLRQLGILPGDIVKVIRHAPFGGPILISISGREIALGQAIASMVNVEEIECVSP